MKNVYNSLVFIVLFPLLLLIGPTSDHTKPPDGYFIHASTPSLKHRIQSALIEPGVDYCLEFYYHAYGVHVGSLSVFLQTGDKLGSPVFSRSKNQGNSWLRGEVRIKNILQPYNIVFEAYVYQNVGV